MPTHRGGARRRTADRSGDHPMSIRTTSLDPAPMELRRRRVTKGLLTCGAVGAPLFLAVILIEGVLRRGYDPIQQMSSALSLGDRGWIQITNFVITGSLMIAFAAGLRRALHSGRSSVAGPLLVGCYGVGLIGAGIFVGDASNGYPPGTPPGPVTHTTLHGTLHNAFSIVVFLSLAAACLVLAARFATERGGRLWMLYSAATGVALPALQPLLNALTPATDDSGLIQKITIAVGWGWIALVAIRLIIRPLHRQ
ncbi:DUF998 domain-containing protein [Spirillospora sp. CA-255316]